MVAEKINIQFGWNERHPLGELDIEFCTGQLYCFIGNNGTGKSTLYRTLLGILKPISGSVPKSFSDYAVVVSDYVSIPSEGRVSDLVRFAVSPKGEETSLLSCAEFEQYVQSLWNQRLTSLSSGQKKILELYIALINGKKWFIFDEATNCLDRTNRNLLFKYINTLLDVGAGVIYTTHNLEEIVLLQGTVYLLSGYGPLKQLSKDDLSIDGLDNVLGV